MAAALQSKAFSGASVRAESRVARSARRVSLVVRAAAPEREDVSRRAALSLLSAAALLSSSTNQAKADFGEPANVFGKVTNKSGFIPYAGEGFALLLPSKWNPSQEKDFPGVVLRYEDNGDAVNNVVVISQTTDKKDIGDFGDPSKFLEGVGYLLGKQSYNGETQSEGGFAPNRVSAASLLDLKVVEDKKGKKYYAYDILTRTADGDEGGRHQLIRATVADGKLWICKVQIGDKRWFKGASKDAKGSIDSFTVA